MKLVKLIANLGYGSRRDVIAMFRDGRITDAAGAVLYTDDPLPPAGIRVDGDALDPLPGLVIALHKPVGYTCSTRDPARLVHDLLPPRFRQRKPSLSPVGRLDRDTSGLLLLTDDGQLLHRIISPKSALTKVYEVQLAEDLRGDEAARFASGSFMLEAETTPLAPARMETLGPRQARLHLTEGRYHQVRRMFAATGNAVTVLSRSAVGGLRLEDLDLAPGAWRILDDAALEQVFKPPAPV